MELVNDFTVNAPIDEAWATLTDLERIAPCMPGAQLTEIEGETYRGLVKVKVGPITAQFKGQAHFVERDADAHRAALKAEGRDTGGKGNASAIITAQLVEVAPSTTQVTVTTDLTITGKVAQFGRGALADVSDKLLKQFVNNLETTVLNEPSAGAEDSGTSAGDGAADAAPALDAPAAGSVAEAGIPAPSSAPSAPTTPSGAPSVRKIEGAPVEPIDLIGTAGGTLLKRLAPIAIGLIIVLLLLRRRRS
jgi:carbon monoxide dehydrogenase subunit G